MRKLHVVEQTASKHSKFLIFVDWHYRKLGLELKNIGYNVQQVPEFQNIDQSKDKNEKDRQIHLWLNSFCEKTKEKPIIFITENWLDFRYFKNPKPKYHVFEVKGQYELSKLVNKD